MPSGQVQSRLLTLAIVFVAADAAALSLAPAARARTWGVKLQWAHWVSFAIWLGGFLYLQRTIRQRYEQFEPYLLPIVALLSGWGLMTIWRLAPTLGVRQTIWLAIAMSMAALGIHTPQVLKIFRQYKYLWLVSGLLLTGVTLIFGTNPLGGGPRLWLGCCGIYLQPSEPLKLLLIVYLAAYLADQSAQPYQEIRSKGGHTSIPWQQRLKLLLPVLTPTLILTSLAMLLLIVQRDLGTTTIFLLVYTALVYLATADQLVILAGGANLLIASGVGYFLYDVVRLRVDAWLNPWLDPSGRSYQIVQSLIAVANGGLLGRGPGMGSPSLVPVAHSDFVFSAIAEESGLLGTLGLILILALLVVAGFRIALNTAKPYQAYLAAGITTYLVVQSIWIIAGNLRLLPLTGVTLPFVSYGGSSLVTSFLSFFMLLTISAERTEELRPVSWPTRTYLQIGAALLAGLAITAFGAGWWGYVRGPDLLTRTDNARRAITDRFVARGALLDRGNQPINLTIGEPGDYQRQTRYPALSNTLGYTHPVYGQTGAEATLDEYLRGLAGYPGLMIWWNHLLYGQPPPGLSVRLTLDLNLQTLADQALAGRVGAAVILNPQTGEILAIASHPTFDANQLNEDWPALIEDPQAPLLNRATLGRYPADGLVTVFSGIELQGFFNATVPHIRLDTGSEAVTNENGLLYISPLHAAVIAAVLSNAGTFPPVHLAAALETPQAGWELLPPLMPDAHPLTADTVLQVTGDHQIADTATWQITMESQQPSSPGNIVWYLGGTLPEWDDNPIALAIVIEAGSLSEAEKLGKTLLQSALLPAK